MSILLLAAAVLLAVAVPVLVWALVPVRALPAASRLAPPAVAGGAPSAAGLPGPVAADDPGPFGFIASRASREKFVRDLALAGLTGRWPLARLLRVKAIVLGAALLVGVLLVAPAPSFARILIALVVLAIGYVGPDLIVDARVRERQAEIQRELPDVLDQITISIEAGLGLETAVARAGQHGTGPLAAELTRTVQDMRVGFTRKEAYTALAERTTVADLRRFARAIMQADQYGVPIGNVVRTQAKEMRAKRKQRAEERAMKIPVTVLFPLMFCILPVLFIVVLAPAVLNLMRILG